MNAVLKISDYHGSPLTNDIKYDRVYEEDRFALAEELEKASKTVHPLASEDEVNMVVMELAKKSMRDVCLFVLGCNTQLRISDILHFRWGKILDRSTGAIKDEFSIVERKNKKPKHVYVNDAIKIAVRLYLDSIPPVDYDDYMFVSYGPNSKTYTVVEDGCIVRRRRPVTEQFVGCMIRNATKSAGIWKESRKFGTHTMRKTGARAAFGALGGRKLPKSIQCMGTQLEYVRDMMGHSNSRVTAKYIDLKDLFDRKMYLWMNLGIEALKKIQGDIVK